MTTTQKAGGKYGAASQSRDQDIFYFCISIERLPKFFLELLSLKGRDVLGEDVQIVWVSKLFIKIIKSRK